MAHIFGVRYLSMLGGFVFLSHQVGSFMGAWLGGKLYDSTGSYDLVWVIAVALGVFAALINLPVRESPITAARRGAGMKRTLVRWLTSRHVWRAAAVLALALVFMAYLRPDLMFELSNLVWSCF